MFSISIFSISKVPYFITVDLVPLRQINADLRSAKEVLVHMHEIALDWSSPFLITINSASLAVVVVQALLSYSTRCYKNQRGECSMFDIEHST